MSADNYYHIVKHPEGGWAALMGFMSDDRPVQVSPKHRQFATVAEAIQYANQDYAEYGTTLSPEAEKHLLQTEVEALRKKDK